MTVSHPLVEVTNLRIGFPSAGAAPLEAVRGIDLTIHEGEVLGLVGESGSGKSLTGLSLMGLLPRPGRVSGGDIRFAGQNLAEMSEAALRRLRGRDISMVFQEPLTALNPVMSVGDQIAEALKVHGLARGQGARERALLMLEAVKVPDAALRMNEFPHQLSGGMRQRVVIAMALACEPRLIVADEPTTALDVTIQAQVLGLMGDLRHRFGTAILMISHDLGVIARTCDRVAVMYAGRIVETGTALEVFLAPRHPYTVALLAATPRPGATRGPKRRMVPIPGIVPQLADMPTGCAFAPRCAHASPACVRDPSLLAQQGRHAVACHHPVTSNE